MFKQTTPPIKLNSDAFFFVIKSKRCLKLIEESWQVLDDPKSKGTALFAAAEMLSLFVRAYGKSVDEVNKYHTISACLRSYPKLIDKKVLEPCRNADISTMVEKLNKIVAHDDSSDCFVDLVTPSLSEDVCKCLIDSKCHCWSIDFLSIRVEGILTKEDFEKTFATNWKLRNTEHDPQLVLARINYYPSRPRVVVEE